MTKRQQPEAAWHYTNAGGLLGIITNNVIWASSAAFMNDEQELIKGQTLIQDTLDTDAAHSTTERTYVHELLQMIQDPERQDFILSASESSDSLTLWRNYGREAVSYAIGLDKNARLVPLAKKEYADTSDFPFADDDYYAPYLDGAYRPNGELETFMSDNPDNPVFRHNRTWQRVVYEPEMQTEIINRVTRDFVESRQDMQAPRIEDVMGLTRIIIKRDLSLIKDQGFSDEHEIRRHYSFVRPRWKFVHYRPSELGITPYICLTKKVSETRIAGEYGAFNEFESQAHQLPILAIRIGPCRYPELAELALRALLNEHGYSKTQIFRSKVSFR